MALYVNLNADEEKAVKELRSRVENDLPPERYADTWMFYRFLKVRKFDLGKAEIMLRKHIIWRKAYQLENILEIFKPMEVFEKYVAPQFIGYSKDDCAIFYMPLGKTEILDIIKCMKMSDYEKNMIYAIEKNLARVKEENMKNGKNCSEAILIFDLDHLTFSNATHRSTQEIFFLAVSKFQFNYPKILKSLYIINAPVYYTFVYSFVKRILSKGAVGKIHVYSQNGWKDVLLDKIEEDVLPAFLGGNRTDPDGNPLCLSFICHGGPFPSKCYLSDEDRWFKDKSLVKKVCVPPGERHRVFVEVKVRASLIQWEFLSKGRDIGFGLFREEDKHLIEVLPIIKFNTPDGTEKFSYKAQSIGRYVIVFDNTYSWLRSKEVHYCVTVSNPES